jgi:outer membrane protein assembly factor BamB
MRATLSLLLTSVALPAAMLATLAAAPGTRWPSFRGVLASGVADGQRLPDTWDLAAGTHVRWRTPLPGLAHSSPVVWDDTIFVTTAISGRGAATFRKGLYGAGDASDDRSPHEWQVIALERATGRVGWTRTAFRGEPREKRHIKATYANQTPATDGTTVVAFFGSQGLYAYDMRGTLRWQQDLGVLNAGAYDLPEYEWGNASSPVIDDGRVYVQCDVHGASFVQAFDLRTGRSLWKTERTELPSWATPTVVRGPRGKELVTNAPNRIRAYDPATGRLLWELGGSSKITAPTPILARDLIVVASGRAPERPIFAVRPGARGDLTLAPGKTSSEAIAWSHTQRGPYMPTPIAYGNQLYTLANQGLFDAYAIDSGAEIYRQRIPHGGSGFSASPVASDDRLFLSSEDGDVFVVRAGPAFELVARNAMGEPIMATPAIAGGLLIVRTERQLVAIGR